MLSASLLLALAPLTPAGPEAPDPAQLLEVVAALEAGAPALAALTPAHAEEVVSILAERRVQAGEGRILFLSGEQDEALLAWLAGLPPGELRRVLEALALEGAFLDREVGVRALERAGAGSDLSLLVRLARPETPLEARRAPRRCEAAVDAMVRREPPLLIDLREAFQEAHPALQPSILRAAPACPEGLTAFASLLGLRPEADVLVLTAIERAAKRAPEAPDRRLTGEVLRLASTSDVAASVAAIGALEALDDAESVPLLVGLLDHPNGGVRQRAERALVALTGQHLASPEEWDAWCQGEEEWWCARGADCLTRLGIARDAEVVALLRELGRHRLYRHAIAPAIVGELEVRGADVAAYGAAVLGNLGSRTAVPALSRLALEQEDPTASRALSAALARLGVADPLAEVINERESR